MDKAEQLNKIMEAIKEYHSDDEENSATLFLNGDLTTGLVTTDCKGNGVILAQSFGNQMINSPKFNRLMKSLMGSYLSQHPEEKKEFLQGLELTKDTPSLN
jgi:hypothetical protein